LSKEKEIVVNKAKLTQEQIIEKTGAKKGYISIIQAGENDIQISTLYKITDPGRRKRLNNLIT
jgi:hypothetical protein